MTPNASDLPLRCRCGHVRGVARRVAPSTGLRFICYCRDCQAFAGLLERPDVLDLAGGTGIFQMPVGRIEITARSDALRCLRFSSSVYRWYADCCRTPVGNTAGPLFPVVGLILSFVDADERSLDGIMGAPRCRLFGTAALGRLPSDAPAPPSLRLRAQRLATILGWWMGGLGRPNPFFDGRTRAPLSPPRTVTAQERAARGT